ncbi:hypothetical protein FCS21_11860 [Colwellia ponticola]|uniref:Uncharacterized protein n=1 Tax=Colwellia ponticola TaxID=2304625 RepID=A0A8H2JKK0_9GAMM|nr:hypothetical protein FCS21_11860 [Colwellia ponticola]
MNNNSNHSLVKERLVVAILIVKLLKVTGEFLPVAIELINMAIYYSSKQVRWLICPLPPLGFINLKLSQGRGCIFHQQQLESLESE